MGRKNLQTLIVVFCCLLASCKKDKPEPIKNIAPPAGAYVYVVCEGNFGLGEASLYAYAPAGSTVYGDIYSGANHLPLGDVLQSMARIGDRFFLCVNNSNKVAVIDTGDKKLVTNINLPNPRYILPVSASKAYITTLYSNKVYVINPQSCTITDTIALPDQNPEGLCLYNNDIMICTWDTTGNHIFRIDGITNKVKQAIQVSGYAPQAVLEDKEHMLWVLAGDQPQGKSATLTRIDPSSGDILFSYQFPANADPLKPVFNPTKDTLYFIEANYYGGTSYNGIFRIGIHEPSLPDVPFVAAEKFQYFWALGIDPVSGAIYIGDPKGFVQKGTVYIYRPDGAKTGSFDVGIGPGNFYFDE